MLYSNKQIIIHSETYLRKEEKLNYFKYTLFIVTKLNDWIR